MVFIDLDNGGSSRSAWPRVSTSKSASCCPQVHVGERVKRSTRQKSEEEGGGGGWCKDYLACGILPFTLTSWLKHMGGLILMTLWKGPSVDNCMGPQRQDTTPRLYHMRTKTRQGSPPSHRTSPPRASALAARFMTSCHELCPRCPRRCCASTTHRFLHYHAL